MFKILAITSFLIFSINSNAVTVVHTDLVGFEMFVQVEENTGISKCDSSKPECASFLYIGSVAVLEQEIERECSRRNFSSYSIVRTRESKENPDILKMEGICKK